MDGSSEMSDGDSVEQLSRRVEQLTKELTDLREQLATEIRTKRLVVLDENDIDRIVLQTHDDLGRADITVSTASGNASVQLEAVSVEPYDGLWVALQIERDGEMVGSVGAAATGLAKRSLIEW